MLYIHERYTNINKYQDRLHSILYLFYVQYIYNTYIIISQNYCLRVKRNQHGHILLHLTEKQLIVCTQNCTYSILKKIIVCTDINFSNPSLLTSFTFFLPSPFLLLYNIGTYQIYTFGSLEKFLSVRLYDIKYGYREYTQISLRLIRERPLIKKG